MDAAHALPESFIASFKLGITNCQATYDKDGRCILKVKEVLFEDLPQQIKDKLIKDFAGYSVRKPQYFEVPATAPYYSLTLLKGAQAMNIKLKASDASLIVDGKQQR